MKSYIPVDLFRNQMNSIDFNKERIVELDMMKLLAMLMVVAIHVFGLVFNNPKQFAIYNSFLLIADPLFFFSSGFLFFASEYYKNKKKKMRFFKRQVYIIFVFFVYSILLIFFERRNISHILYLIIHPHQSLWYLMALFVIRAVAFIFQSLSNTKRNRTALFCAFFITFVLTLFFLFLTFGNYFDIGHIAYYSLFFLFGCVASKKTLEDYLPFTRNRLFPLFVLNIDLLLFFIFIKLNSIYSYGPQAILLRFFVGVLSIVFFYTLFQKISACKPIRKISYFGTITLFVYFFHLLFIELIRINVKSIFYQNDDVFFFATLYLFVLFLSIASSLLMRKVFYLIRKVCHSEKSSFGFKKKELL